MRGLSRRAQMLLAAIPVALLVLAFLVFPGEGSRTVTAHFDRAVAVYPGTDLRVMGVRIGKVTAVVPDGNSVRVEMKYDGKYSLPAGAKAAVVTPTLVADRYVQVFPAYGSGPKLGNNADIPLGRTQVPVELDRMFKALDDLSTTLGPKSGTTSGSLDKLLSASAKALDGNGALGSKLIRNLSAAADTFAHNRGPLFDNVRALADVTDTLATNDSTVQTFVKSLTAVSSQLAGEKDEFRDVLASLAKVLGSVKGFVHENRATLGKDIDLLSSVLNRVDKQKDALGLVLQKGPLAMSNLAIAFDPTTGTYGSRVQVTPGIQFRPDQFLCATLTADGVPQSVCDLITSLLKPLLPTTSGSASKARTPAPTTDPSSAGSTPDNTQTGPLNGLPALLSLLGGGRS
jgi:phospholipid/cholesterol/gamma-HCH transport system substrate-binding protein